MKRKVITTNWRTNVLITFFNKEITHLNRERLHTMLSYFAYLYKLDYVISVAHKEWHDAYSDFSELPQQAEVDMFYFRATPSTRVSAAQFRQAIKSTFFPAFSVFHDLEVSLLYQKDLKYYPFPRDYHIWGMSF